MLKLHTPSEMFVPIAPYAQSIEANHLLLISGTLGLGQMAALPPT